MSSSIFVVSCVYKEDTYVGVPEGLLESLKQDLKEEIDKIAKVYGIVIYQSYAVVGRITPDQPYNLPVSHGVNVLKIPILKVNEFTKLLSDYTKTNCDTWWSDLYSKYKA